MIGWIAATVASLLLVTHNPNTPDWSDLYQRVSPTIVPIHAKTETWEGPVCTAVGVEGVLLTAAHCFGRKAVYSTPYGPVKGTYAKLGDLVALPLPAGAPQLKLADRAPETGQPVAAFGHAWGSLLPHMFVGRSSLGYDAKLDEHFWATRPSDPPYPLWWFDVKQLHGTSGGPIVDRKGRLLTIVYFTDTHGPGARWLAGAISPALVRNFVRSQT